MWDSTVRSRLTLTKYVINGGKTLNGEVTISGAKNAAVAIVPAALLADGPVRIENVPKIIDVTLQMEIMRELGAQIRLINSTTVEIQNTQNPSLKPHSPSAARACLSKSDSARCVWDRWRWYCPKIICPFSSSTTSLTVVEPTSMPA